ncbi:hypothetical protein F5Y08DRAFT_149424 [Xylaria arbuscula]|nr:hypothetical protein F5Y08DRAFT_149424 [Xylaria arbuscula]
MVDRYIYSSPWQGSAALDQGSFCLPQSTDSISYVHVRVRRFELTEYTRAVCAACSSSYYAIHPGGPEVPFCLQLCDFVYTHQQVCPVPNLPTFISTPPIVNERLTPWGHLTSFPILQQSNKSDSPATQQSAAAPQLSLSWDFYSSSQLRTTAVLVFHSFSSPLRSFFLTSHSSFSLVLFYVGFLPTVHLRTPIAWPLERAPHHHALLTHCLTLPLRGCPCLALALPNPAAVICAGC